MDDNTVTAVHICNIIPCSLVQGSLMVLVLVDIVSPVYLCAVCSQVTHFHVHQLGTMLFVDFVHQIVC